MTYKIERNRYHNCDYCLFDEKGHMIASYGDDPDDAIRIFNTMASMTGLNQRAKWDGHTCQGFDMNIVIEEINANL